MIRVILADDERLIRDAVAGMLSLVDDIEVVGTASTADEAVTLAVATEPDVAVLDVQMPGESGLTVPKELADRGLATRCLILTSHAVSGTMQKAMVSGAQGFVPKDIPVSELVDIIRKIAAGDRYVDPSIAAESLSQGPNPLTEREIAVLAVAIGGDPTDEIARLVGLAGSTVRNHLSSAVVKIGAPNRHVAAQVARERGWI